MPSSISDDQRDQSALHWDLGHKALVAILCAWLKQASSELAEVFLS